MTSNASCSVTASRRRAKRAQRVRIVVGKRRRVCFRAACLGLARPPPGRAVFACGLRAVPQQTFTPPLRVPGSNHAVIEGAEREEALPVRIEARADECCPVELLPSFVALDRALEPDGDTPHCCLNAAPREYRHISRR